MINNQERNEVRWCPGQEASLAPPCSNLRSFGSKCTILKKVLSTLLGLLEPPQSFSNPTVVRSHHSDSAPGELCPSCPRRYAPVKNIVNWENSHMPSKQSCICLTHSVHKVWEWLSICENEATIDYHHGSALKLRNRPACRYSLTQWLVSWSSPVVPKV